MSTMKGANFLECRALGSLVQHRYGSVCGWGREQSHGTYMPRQSPSGLYSNNCTAAAPETVAGDTAATGDERASVERGVLGVVEL